MADSSVANGGANGVAINNENAVEAEEAQKLISDYVAAAAQNPWVSPLMTGYEKTKSSNEWLAATLGAVESRLGAGTALALQQAIPIYKNYYVAPRESLSAAINNGKEKTTAVLVTGKETAVRGGTVGLGAAVVATQLALALSAGGAALALDTIDAGQKAAGAAVQTVRDIEKAVERRVWKALSDAYAIARIPADKAADTGNAVLDLITTVVERTLHVTVPVEETEATLASRVSKLSSTVANALSDKAHTEVIDPANAQLRTLLEHISKSFILMDIVRQKKVWALEKMDELSASVSDLKTRIETESLAYRKSPEEILMTGIQSTSKTLTDKLTVLKQKNVQVFGDGNKMDTAIGYLQQLETNLAEAGDLYAVRDEVLSEARQRLADLMSWSGNLLARPSPTATGN